MHELSLAMNLVEVITAEGVSQGFTRVGTVFVEVGTMSNVEPEALRLCFEAAKIGTIAEHAALDLTIVPARGRCRLCAHEFPLESYADPCPACGAFGHTLLAGGELKIRELEVD